MEFTHEASDRTCPRCRIVDVRGLQEGYSGICGFRGNGYIGREMLPVYRGECRSVGCPGAERPMRAATYTIPAAEGDTEGAECAVFYFGPGAGGDVVSNIDRWVGQFEPTSGPDKASKQVNGMEVTTVRIGGAYLNPSGPMMQSAGQEGRLQTARCHRIRSAGFGLLQDDRSRKDHRGGRRGV